MGLSTYLGTKNSMDSYRSKERVCDMQKIVKKSLQTMYQLRDATAIKVVGELQETPSSLKEFLMTNKFEATSVENYEALIGDVSWGLGYLAGGSIPIVPYLVVEQQQVLEGPYWSIGIMVVVLTLFGYTKTTTVAGWSGSSNVKPGLRGVGEMLVVGGAAAASRLL